MMDLPLEVIEQKIIEESGISKKELDDKIKAKLEQLSGLISKEGAAHIVANELGVNLLQAKGLMKIKHILSGMKNVELIVKVIRKYETRAFDNGKRKGSVSRFLVGDETGTTMIVLWNDQAALINTFNEGDQVKIIGANARENNSRLELHLSDTGKIDVNPEGANVQAKPFEPRSYPAATRKKISELKADDNNVEIFATIVQVFDPRFFEVCPQCFKRARSDGTNFACQEHGKVTPGYSAVLNVFVDDGSDNVRVVLWRNAIHELLGTNDAKLLMLKDNPSKFEEAKTELLGVMAKFLGRVSNNDMFGRLEFIANKISRNVSPEEEMKHLESNAPAPKAAAMPEPKKPVAIAQKEEKPAAPMSELDEEILSLEDLEDIEEDL